MFAIGGVPLFFMELALGQYHRKGAITCWSRVVPLFKGSLINHNFGLMVTFCFFLLGIGFSVVLIAFYVDLYYNVIIAWALHFFFRSFSSELPWAKCNNPWNTEKCFEISDINVKSANATSFMHNSAALEYFKLEILF